LPAGSDVEHPVFREQIATHYLGIVPGHGFAPVPNPSEIPARPFTYGSGDPPDVFVIRAFYPGEHGHGATLFTVRTNLIAFDATVV
jgi:hypothetical protein